MAGDEGRSIRMSESETELRKKSRCQGRIGRLERAGESGRVNIFHKRTAGSGCAKGDRGSQDFDRQGNKPGG